MRKFIDIIAEANHCSETMERSRRYAKDSEDRAFDERRRLREEGDEAEIDEGWKSSLVGAATGAAAMVGLGSDITPADSYDDMTFTAAFAQAMDDKGEGDVFTWRGKTYKLETSSDSVTDDYVLKTDTNPPESAMSADYDRELSDTFLRPSKFR